MSYPRQGQPGAWGWPEKPTNDHGKAQATCLDGPDKPFVRYPVDAGAQMTGATKSSKIDYGASRDNSGKPKYSILPLDCLDGTVRILEFGAKKYGRNNWRKGLDPLETLDSLMRHLVHVQKALEDNNYDGTNGRLYDPDHGYADAHAVVVNALFLIDAMRKKGFNI